MKLNRKDKEEIIVAIAVVLGVVLANEYKKYRTKKINEFGRIYN